jgi:hypothetical protein
VLDPATARGALPLALHPVMTFTGTSVDLPRLTGVPFGVTAPDPLRPAAEALVVEMGGDPVWVAEGHRVLYHAALAHGSNHLITLEAQVLDLLRSAGVEQPARLVAPLLSAALDNVLRYGDTALTGPVARGDAGTVAAHLAEISAVAPETRATYVALARATADRALANGMLRADAAERLLDAGRAQEIEHLRLERHEMVGAVRERRVVEHAVALGDPHRVTAHLDHERLGSGAQLVGRRHAERHSGESGQIDAGARERHHRVKRERKRTGARRRVEHRVTEAPARMGDELTRSHGAGLGQPRDQARQDVVGHGQQHEVGRCEHVGHGHERHAGQQRLRSQPRHLRHRVGRDDVMPRAGERGTEHGSCATGAHDTDAQPRRCGAGLLGHARPSGSFRSPGYRTCLSA